MKKLSIKSVFVLIGFMLVCSSANAAIGGKIKSFFGNELAQFHSRGLFLIGGVVIAGILSYFVRNLFDKEEETDRVHRPLNHTVHHRRHHHKIIK